MGYADHVGAQRPNCWGNAKSYDLHDPECAECRFKHSCRSEINKTRNYGTPMARSRYREENVDAAEYEPGVVGDHEKPIERFTKDCIAGGLRGIFHEAWQFWRRYRIR